MDDAEVEGQGLTSAGTSYDGSRARRAKKKRGGRSREREGDVPDAGDEQVASASSADAGSRADRSSRHRYSASSSNAEACDRGADAAEEREASRLEGYCAEDEEDDGGAPDDVTEDERLERNIKGLVTLFRLRRDVLRMRCGLCGGDGRRFGCLTGVGPKSHRA